jgi:MFS family permease
LNKRGGTRPLAGASLTAKSRKADARAPDDRGQRRAGGRRTLGWLRGVTPTVAILGVTSFFTDLSSEMIVPLRLIFLVQVLGTPLAIAGLIEGLAEGATGFLKVVSGRAADRVSDRRSLIVGGYTLSNLSKPLLALVGTWPPALALILSDRAGKAVRGSPRDALIAESAPPDRRGMAFGFHRGADTLGAALGPLLAVAILAVTGNRLRDVFGWTIVPGVLAIVCAVVFLRDPRAARRSVRDGGTLHNEGTEDTENTENRRPEARETGQGAAGGRRARRPQPWSATRRGDTGAKAGEASAAGRTGERPWSGLGPRFWLFAAIGTCFALGNSSDAFLFLRTEGLEASLAAVPLIYCAFNVVYALLATPFGALSDRIGRLPVLAVGYAAFTLVYLGWTRAHAPWHAWALFLAYGVYYAATEGIARAFVADLAPTGRRGTALGWYNGLTGAAALPANLAGAWLWSRLGPGATFGLAAWLGAVAFCLLIAWWPWLKANPRPWPDYTTADGGPFYRTLN